MQLTMEPLEEMLESARVMDEAGMDTIWLAEAYPWWRKHGMEARSSTVVSALMARETERLTIGWGIVSPFTRHPVQTAMDARVVQEAAGPGRFLLGFGTSKIFLNNAKLGDRKISTLGAMRDAVEIARGVLGGRPFDYDGPVFSASVPALAADAEAPREVPPVYVAATARARSRACTSRTRCRTSAALPTRSSSWPASTWRRSVRWRRRWRPAGDSPPRSGSRTRSSTVAGRSRGRRRTASRRSRSTATRAARTSCWSCGARTGCNRSGSSASRCCRTCAHEDRRGTSRRPRRAPRVDTVVHGVGGGGRGPDAGRAGIGGRHAGAVAAGRGGAGERARDVGGHGRRADAHVQRAPGHVVLGPRAVAGRDSGLPAAGVRARRARLWARDLEHEGRARVLRRGIAGAGGSGSAAARRRDDRCRLRRDREGAGRRRAGRRVPRVRGRLAASRRARRRGGHVHHRRADREQARPRALRDAVAAALHARAVRAHRVQRRAARGELDRAHAAGARRGARLAAALGGGDELRRR